MKTSVAEIRTAIISGDLDASLNDISQALKIRREMLQSKMMDTLQPGQHVWFTSNIRPTYLIGKEAEILRVNRKRVAIKILDKGYLGRFGTCTSVNCHPSLLTTQKPS